MKGWIQAEHGDFIWDITGGNILGKIGTSARMLRDFIIKNKVREKTIQIGTESTNTVPLVSENGGVFRIYSYDYPNSWQFFMGQMMIFSIKIAWGK